VKKKEKEREREKKKKEKKKEREKKDIELRKLLQVVINAIGSAPAMLLLPVMVRHVGL
jgi:hypothetical protein